MQDDELKNDEREEREERYRVSQSDISIIRKEINKLGGALGEIKTAITGDAFGNEGLANRVKTWEEKLDDMDSRLSDMEVANKKRETNFAVIFTLVGGVVTALIMHLINKIFPTK